VSLNLGVARHGLRVEPHRKLRGLVAYPLSTRRRPLWSPLSGIDTKVTQPDLDFRGNPSVGVLKAHQTFLRTHDCSQREHILQ
jgi:hypothetical protein